MRARIVKLGPDGVEGSGLEDWGPMDPAELESGEGLQRGAMAFEDEALGLSVGVWDCTPMTVKQGPYSVDEFMVLLSGEVAIRTAQGPGAPVRAGESFVIPRGLDCAWTQSVPLRKIFVILAAPTAGSPPRRDKRPVPDAIVRVDPAILDASLTEDREERLYRDATGRLAVTLQLTTARPSKAVPHPCHELMHVLEGRVALTDGEGRRWQAGPGETLFVPRGTPCSWASKEAVRLVRCAVVPTS